MRRLEILLGDTFPLEKFMAGVSVISEFCGVFLVVGVMGFFSIKELIE